MADVIISNSGSLVINGGSSSMPKGGYTVTTDGSLVYVKAIGSSTGWKLDPAETTLDGASFGTPQDLVTALSDFSRGGTGPGPEPGDTVWGGITGTLSNQTDLQNALNGKATSAQGALAESALQSLQEGDNITIDNSNPNSPIISATGGGSSLAAGSGLRIDNGEIKLGSDSLSFSEGKITEDTIIGDLDVDGIGKGIMFDGRSSLLSILNRYEEEDFQAVSRIDISDSSVNILSGDYDPSLGEYTRVGGINVNREHASFGLNSDQGLIGLQLETVGDQVFTDSINNKGLVYESDYSANFTDNSLVTKKYVDEHAPAPHTHPSTQISDSTATGRSVLTAASAAAARTAIGAGTSSLALGTTGSTALAGNTPVVKSQQESGVGTLVTNIIQVTQAEYDGLTPQAGTFYVIVG